MFLSDAQMSGIFPEFDGIGNGAYRLLRGARRALVEAFRASVRDPEHAQRGALARVLDAAEGTTFADRHALRKGMTLAEYRSAVPVRSSAEFQPWLWRVAEGETRALLRHPVESLVKTSGTTGEPKLLPVTRSWAREVSDAQYLWVLGMVKEQEAITRGKVLTSVGKAVEGRSAGGIPYGSNTGRMAAAQPWWLQGRYAVPAAVHAIDDVELRYYVMLRLALAKDVVNWTTANPSTVLAVCRAMQRYREQLSADLADGTLCHGPAAALDRATRRRFGWWWARRRVPADFRPASFWRLAAINCWKGGSAGYFIERLPEAVGAVLPVREAGITASEGYFAIPLHSSWAGGVAWTLGHLLEFVPVEGGEPRTVTELETGREYRLVISTTAGLYRYDLDDVVRVQGWYHAAPILGFVRKGRDMISVTGEKVSADQVVAAVREALPGELTGFSVGVQMAERPVYTLVVEGAAPFDAAQAFDAALQRLNQEYASKRGSDRLADPVVVVAPEGTYRRFRAARMASGTAEGQVKDPVLLHGESLREFLVKFAG